MSEAVRPLAFGYIGSRPEQTAREVERLKVRLCRYAWREGYSLGPIWSERGQRPSAFEAMTDAAVRLDAVAVIVPSADHVTAEQISTLARRANISVRALPPEE
jgi:hypothetical protein